MPLPQLVERSRMATVTFAPASSNLKLTATSPAVVGPASGAGPAYQLAFTMQTQGQDEWCWAAVAVSVSLFYSKTSPWIQCALVNQQFGQNSCCINGSTDVCDQPSALDGALNLTGNLLTWVQAPLTAATIQAQLAAGRAIGCRIDWGDPQHSGHFVVISGYINDGTVETVTVEDPLGAHSVVNLTQFTTAYQNSGTWTDSYYTMPSA